MSHALLPLTAVVLAGRERIVRPVALAGMGLAMLPDADTIGFAFGVDYASQWGHRGFSHALLTAGVVASLVVAAWPRARDWTAALFLFAAMASHGILDLFTDGGKGVMLLWPFDDTRWFGADRPIRVAPIGARFFTPRGIETALSELAWIWMPCVALMAGAVTWRRFSARENPARHRR